MQSAVSPTRGTGTKRIGRDLPVFPPVGPTKVSSSVYTDPARLEEELEKVFFRSWIIVDRSSAIPNPGDYLVWEEIGQTVVVSRLEDGSVRAFHNVCMHRGARIVDPDRGNPGHCADLKFECPWHGWQYDQTGSVVGVPARIDFDAAELKDVRAMEVAVHEFAGWIWMVLDPEHAVDFEEWMGPEILEELGHFSMGEWEVNAFKVWEMECNWKAVVDAFIEVYHLYGAHKNSIGDGLSQQYTYQWLFDRHSMYVVPSTERIEAILDSEDHIADAISHYYVFPVNTFNCSASSLQMFQAIPVDVNTTRYKCWYLCHPGGDEEYMDRVRYGWEGFCKIAEEDLYAAKQVGSTGKSIAYKRNIMNQRECRIPHFLENIERMIRE